MKLNKIVGTIAMTLLALSLLLTVIDYFCFDRSFYKNQYLKNNTTAYTNMSEEDLMKATDTLLDYLRDKRDDIKVEGIVNGAVREIYDERETLHMVDVKALYLNVIKVRNWISMIGIGALLLSLFFYKGNKYYFLRGCFNKGITILFLIVIAILLYALADFNRFWTNFHHVFFTNDLWLLDPNISIMINMFPEQFFRAIVLRIIFWYLGIILVLWSVLNIPYYRSIKG